MKTGAFFILKRRSSISSSTGAANLNIHPNPTTGMVTISGSFNTGDGVCNIYNMMGVLVYSKNINLNEETTLNLSSLPQGAYMVEVADNSNVYRSKIIISK